jgi:hypothetical protein
VSTGGAVFDDEIRQAGADALEEAMDAEVLLAVRREAVCTGW